MILEMPPWLEIAEKELGVHEIPGPQSEKRVLEYHQATILKATADEVPWCSSFACWVMDMCDLESPKSAMARSWLKWGVRLTVPAFGCIVVLSRPPDPASGHVGFYVGSTTPDTIRVLAGNQGDKVSIANFPRSRILQYRWI